MTWGYIAGAAISVAGSVASNKSAKSAAKKGRNAAAIAQDKELLYAREGRDTAIALGQPYRTAANSSLAAMMDMMGLSRDPSGAGGTGGLENLPPGVTSDDLSGYEPWQLETDPGYQFRLSEGTRAMDASASSRGQLYSGGAMRDATAWGQDMASQEYQNIYNRLSNMAGLGAGAMTTGAQGATNAAGQQIGASNNNTYTRVSSYAAEANADSDLYGDIGKAVGGFDWGSVFNSGGGGGGGTSKGAYARYGK